MQKITKKSSETSTDVSLQQNKFKQLFLYQKGFNESLRVRCQIRRCEPANGDRLCDGVCGKFA